jgi:hypothetical protein
MGNSWFFRKQHQKIDIFVRTDKLRLTVRFGYFQNSRVEAICFCLSGAIMSFKKLVILLIIGLFLSASVAWADLYTIVDNGNKNPDPNSGPNPGNTNPNSGSSTNPKTYALLIGSSAPSDSIANAVRGDIDVDHVASQLSWATDIVTLKYNWNNAQDFAGDIQSAAANFASKVKPGDSFIFYYSGHGLGGSGDGVQDYLNPINGSLYQDNTLAGIFADSLFGNVKKLFLIDSCHAEGIWKNDTANDKDLQTLHNISFLGSSSEDDAAYADTTLNGTGLFTNAILPSLKPDATFGSLLLTAMATRGTQVSGYFKDEVSGQGAGIMDSVGYASGDLDLGSTLGGQPVPEPAVLSLILAGIAFAFIWRRRG